MEKRSYEQTYRWGTERLREAEIAEAELDARLLLEYVCGTDRNTLLVHGDREVTAEENESYVNLISERRKRIPLQHLTGKQEFMGLEFYVNQDVLIPRQDTEILVEEAMRSLHDGMRILDMCTGSGCILLSLLYYSNDCTGIGVDISEKALAAAGRNAEKINEKKKAEAGKELRFLFLQGDLFEALECGKENGAEEENAEEARTGYGPFEMIVSNPPYIRRDVIDTLMPEVKDHEPLSALDGKEDGLYFYREILKQAGEYLTRGGELFFEIGYDQGQAVKKMMEAAGYREVEVIQDYAGLDRVVRGTRI
ncbi:MAG: peptide chain release factor N(5)-glutamine methyltransferase [Lachnospiraceae bacterium]|nr:peptide chain release factor N(5)-glutamine methyltransferase [Lachnospiraceae bacterium]